jgi:hypothetical protein
MSDRFGNPIARCNSRPATAAVALLMSMIATGVAWPQTAPSAPPSSPAVQAPAQQAPPEENPGLLHEMEKMFEKSLSILPTVKSPGETVDDLNATAKDTGDALSRLAKPSSMVSGRMVCPVSANGAPDCKAGADKLCRSKGFKEGKSLNGDSAETCSPKVLIPGRARKPDDCRTDNYVTRALCQ